MRPTFSALVKRGAAEVLCHPVIGRALSLVYRRVLPYRGARIHAPDALVGGRQQAALVWGTYEKTEARYIEQHLDRTLDVIELGASIGGVSSVLRRAMNPSRRLVSVEADPVLVELARENLRRNAEGAPFVVLHRALDYTDGGQGQASFGRSDVSIAGALTDVVSGADEITLVERTTVEAIAREHGFERYALVSDVEGAEAGLIEGTPETLRGCAQIIIELHRTTWRGRLWTEDAFVERLEQAGFRLCHRYGPVCHFRRD